MATERFSAHVQYGDFKGTGAADRSDNNDATKWLEAKSLKNADEFLVGVELYVGENHGTHRDPVYVHFLLAKPGDFENVRSMIEGTKGPVPVRKVSVNMELTEFFSLFKRFSVAISAKDMLGGHEYSYPE